METVKIKIDGQEIEVPKNITILEAAKKLNKLIPTFCYHEKLPIFGGCRMCLVYDKKINDTVIACGTYVYDGLEIETMNDRVFNDRKFILEMLFTRHPLDCPTCDKAGECDLQNWGTYYGPQINVLPLTPFDKIRPEEDWQSSYLEFISNRCVLCLKCTSVCDNVVGAHTLFQEERGFEILISPNEKPMDTESSCEMCGLCVDVCPVGAILFKPFEHWTRAWLLKEKVTYCGMCSMQCPVAVDYDDKKQKIYRIRSTADLMVCNGAYLGYDIHENNRLKGALINSKETFTEEAIDKTAGIINENPLKTGLILSPYSSNEAIEEALKFAKKTGIKISSTITTDLIPAIMGFVQETGEDYILPSEFDVKMAEKIIVVGDDIANTAPVLSYFFKGNYELGKSIDPDKKEIYYIGNSLDTLKKYFPKEIHAENDEELLEKISKLNKEIDGIDEKTLIIYSSSTFKGEKAYKTGKYLGKLKKETGSQVLIIPSERNAFGLLNRLENFYYLPDIFKEIREGKIKNLILVGEDISEHFHEEEIKEIFSKLENSIIFTPFNDGMALSCNIAIGSSLWMEESGTTEGFRGKKEIRGALKNPQEEKFLWEKLTKKVKFIPEAVKTQQKEFEIYDYEGFVKNEIKLWDFGFMSRRSKNITEWKMKKMAENI
jgi:NADH-quinone oxidoreductase subunit G